MMQVRASVVGGVIIAAMVLAGCYALAHVPADARVPVHFDVYGRPNGYAPAWVGLLSLPFITAALWGLRAILPRIDPRGDRLARSGRAFDTICVATSAVLAAGQTLIVGGTLGVSINAGHFLLAMLGLFLMVIGNVFGKLRWNYTVGIRTPWTLADERVWDQTHRFGGRVFVLGGALLLAASFTMPPARMPAALIVTLAVVTILPVGKSYMLWRQREKEGLIL